MVKPGKAVSFWPRCYGTSSVFVISYCKECGYDLRSEISNLVTERWTLKNERHWRNPPMIQSSPFRGFCAAILLPLAISWGAAAGEAEPRHSLWNGFARLDFNVGGRNCLLVLPKMPAPGNPWIWRTEFFGHEPQADVALLAKGFHAAYINVQNLYGAPAALDAMDAFYARLTKQYHLAPKVVLEGFSRGGLFAFNWAARNPGKVAGLYVDAPVCDFKSWPGGKGRGKGSPGDWERCKQVYGLTEAEALAYRLNPVDNLAPLAQAKIPILSVCGEADTVVPIEENTRLVQRRYQQLGGEIQVIAKPHCEHHPHSLKDPAPIVDFILRHTPGIGKSE